MQTQQFKVGNSKLSSSSPFSFPRPFFVGRRRGSN
ncbi:hypothetical protein BVRB_5g110450 [Beta vulgaris subsp. vulgaris]|nr:hypothetical protein BVRB_5g110450 [Beta vulgaris subsp. vulgaris]